MRVTFLGPMVQREGVFYGVFTDLMRVAAEQLGIELEILDGAYQRDALIERGREIAARSVRPDYVLLVNHMGVAVDLLPQYAAVGLRSFLVAEGMTGGDQAAIGRQGCSTCLGELCPDDIETGHLLAEILVTEARRRGLAGPDGMIHVAVIAGMQAQWSNLRFRGWQRLKEECPDVVQAGFHYGKLDEQGARAAAASLFRSAPQATVFWCANDAVALGVVDAVAEAGRDPTGDVLIGGVDLLDRALAAIVKGSMHVSLGGHVIDGVRALLQLDALHRGCVSRIGAARSHLEPVLAGDAARYLQFMVERAWRDVDFTRFAAGRGAGGESAAPLTLRALVTG